MSFDGPCDVCRGIGKYLKKLCPYCNGTGQWNPTAQAYVANHIYQCIFLDREFCPVCEKKCHHDASLSPKQIIIPGYGGMTSPMQNPVEKEEEEPLPC